MTFFAVKTKSGSYYLMEFTDKYYIYKKGERRIVLGIIPHNGSESELIYADHPFSKELFIGKRIISWNKKIPKEEIFTSITSQTSPVKKIIEFK